MQEREENAHTVQSKTLGRKTPVIPQATAVTEDTQLPTIVYRYTFNTKASLVMNLLYIRRS